MPTSSSRPLARLSGPGDVAAAVPLLCGFRPQDSVVVLSLRGPRRRLGLTVRLDLPPPGQVRAAASLLAQRVAGDGGSAAAVVVVTESGRRDVLVAALVDACADAGLEVVEAVHVAGGRWTSYLCSGACCPLDGTPLPDVPPLVAAERALEGRGVLASREELVRALAAPEAPAPGVEQAIAEHDRRVRADGAAAARAAAAREVRSLLQQVRDGGPVADDDVVRTAAVLHDVAVRDEVTAWAMEESDALLSLAEAVARRIGPPHDAPACSLLAWVAYARGDGARANVALDRALATDQAYGLALLLRQALDGGLPPDLVRRAVREATRAGAAAPGGRRRAGR